MYEKKSELELKNSLTSSEYSNLFGDPFWGIKGCSKARDVYGQLSEKEKALMLKANYEKMIKKARERNWNHAADNLQWWLDGSGFTKIIDFKWLRSKREVLVAENFNIERFEERLNDKKLDQLLKNEGDYIDYENELQRQFTAGIFGELYYMSGTSVITSASNLKITRRKDSFVLSGTIIHTWWDRYDWHKGAHAYIFGFGYVGDSDALLVEKYCGAKPFDMRSTWKQNFNVTFQKESSGNVNIKLR
jgi:hypothetical protein